MARITVLGGTGYAGSNIVKAAAARGHQVTSFSRTAPAPADAVAGATYVTGNVFDEVTLDGLIDSADVVVSALAPRGELAGKTREVLSHVAEYAAAAKVRVGVVGGAGSLQISPGGIRLLDTRQFPAAFKAEAVEMGSVLYDLRASDADLDWFFVSPASGFGSHAPGVATGVYRLGGDVVLSDDNGKSEISGADLADAIVKEIETPAHVRSRFTVAY
ncbi:MAG: NAD(P)H-binding protein [Propionibacteriaceae bacterium]|nr:NAD(P)H-binding protein [Micropruina sp.]HBY24893.1 NAD-dependent epimerase [Propionibacteriaceae bacterium]